jgi:hypothetical protein
VLPFLSPGDLPIPGIEPASPVLQEDSLPLSHQENPLPSWKRLHRSNKNSHSVKTNKHKLVKYLPFLQKRAKKRQLFGNGDTEHRTRLADVGRAEIQVEKWSTEEYDSTFHTHSSAFPHPQKNILPEHIPKSGYKKTAKLQMRLGREYGFMSFKDGFCLLKI